MTTDENIIKFLLNALANHSRSIVTIDGWEEYFKVCPQDRTPDKILEMLLEAVREHGYDSGYYDGNELGYTSGYQETVKLYE